MSERRPPVFVQIWRHHWMLESGVKRLEDEGALLLRADRLTEDFNLAAKLGFEKGIEAGEMGLRRGIEEGRLEPVKVRPQSDSSNQGEQE